MKNLKDKQKNQILLNNSTLLLENKVDNTSSVRNKHNIDYNMSDQKLNDTNINLDNNTDRNLDNKTRFENAKNDEMMPEIIEGLKKMFEDNPEYRDKKLEQKMESIITNNNKQKGRNV